MYKYISVILVFFFIQSNAQKKYFQQDVHYKIDVRLNDESHILHAFETITYKNNSQDTLRFLFFHLWPNAYRNDQSAMCEQMVENGQTSFYFSKEEQRGFIDSLKFKVNGEEVTKSEYNNQSDVIILELLNPLKPNETIEITTPFRVVLPEVFSRLGHHKQTYQISQWYPKPAVYDQYGWHPMPYLDQGEFYSEFGSFTVNITLPENYVVAATGDLQNENEIQFIESKIKDTSTKNETLIPESSSNFKTITFKQNHVHDFAWFADKQFLVEKTIDTLISKRTVNCYSFFPQSMKSIYQGSSKITAKTIHYLSEHVGEYPYQHASVVAGYLLAGGGMEYPNVTVIGSVGSKSMLQTVIIHEVGHNWFYGILGSNEREHPWMDEGINSFYEKKIDKELNKKNKVKENKLLDINEGTILYQLAAKQNIDQAIEGNSTQYTKLNYAGIVYGKTALMLNYLEEYLGDAVFEKCMKAYYDKWHFKHPYPIDVKNIFEEISGKNLDWFFNEGIQSTEKIDFAIRKVQTTQNQTKVFIKNRTNFKGPTPVSLISKDSIISTKWIEFPHKESLTFDIQSNQFSKIKINANESIPEIKLSNNEYHKNALFHKTKMQMKLGTSIGIQYANQLFVLPSFGYNYYDKFMLGGVVHNIKFPNNKFQFAMAPMYSFGTKDFVGTGIVAYSLFTPKNHKITFSLQGSKFHHSSTNLNIPNTLFAHHIKIAPAIHIDFAKKEMRSPVSNQLMIKYYRIWNQGFMYSKQNIDSVFKPILANPVSSGYVKAEFTHKNDRTLNPYNYQITAVGNSHFLKISLTSNLKINYHLKDKAFYIRGFLGKFFEFENYYTFTNAFSLNGTSMSYNDYLYDETFLARNQQKGFLTQQISMQDGGMKILTNLYSTPIGQSDNWLGAVNLRSDIPINLKLKLPIKFQLFLDACTFAQAGKQNPSGNKLVYDAGVQMNLLYGLFNLYVPVLMSKDYRDYGKSIYGKKRFEHYVSFSLNLNKINFLNTQNITKFIGL